jgi:hypothetical protein
VPSPRRRTDRWDLWPFGHPYHGSFVRNLRQEVSHEGVPIPQSRCPYARQPLLPACPTQPRAGRQTHAHARCLGRPFTDPNFCGSGLAVSVHTVGTGSVWIRFNQGTYAIFSDHIHGQDTLTGPNGAVVTVAYDHHGHDDSVVDNGDGTYTDYWTERGVIEKVTFPDGTVVLDRGQITWKFVYGDAGTPGDPSDDYFIAFEGIVDYDGQMPGQTGSVDLCASAVAAFTA